MLLPASGAQRVVPQIVVVVEVLVAQGDAGDALRQHGPQGVHPEPRVAVIGEARGHPVEEPDEAVDLPEQERSRVRRDRPAVERRGDPAALEPLKYEGWRLTMCWHRSSRVAAVKLLAQLNLAAPGGRCLFMGMRNPG